MLNMHLCDAIFGSLMIIFLLLLLNSYSKKTGKLSADIGELQFRCRKCHSFYTTGDDGHAIPPPRGPGAEILAVPCRKTLLVDTPSTTPCINAGLRCDIICSSFTHQTISQPSPCRFTGVSHLKWGNSEGAPPYPKKMRKLHKNYILSARLVQLTIL